MSTTIDIRPHDLAAVRTILHAHLPPGATVWAFGSRATFRARRGSDLDLAIDAGRPLTRTESLDLQTAFEDSDLPYTVDVVDMHDISPTFRATIERTAVPLLHDPAGANRGT